jgi:hypothetical protein
MAAKSSGRKWITEERGSGITVEDQGATTNSFPEEGSVTYLTACTKGLCFNILRKFLYLF